MTHFIIEEMQRQMGTIQIKTYGFPMSPDSVQESALPLPYPANQIQRNDQIGKTKNKLMLCFFINFPDPK